MPAPYKTVKFGNLSSAIWEHVGSDGKKIYYPTIRRRFLDKKTNEWQEEKMTIFEDQLLSVAELCRQTWIAMQEIRNANKQSAGATNIQESIPAEINMDDVPF